MKGALRLVLYRNQTATVEDEDIPAGPCDDILKSLWTGLLLDWRLTELPRHGRKRKMRRSRRKEVPGLFQF